MKLLVHKITANEKITTSPKTTIQNKPSDQTADTTIATTSGGTHINKDSKQTVSKNTKRFEIYRW